MAECKAAEEDGEAGEEAIKEVESPNCGDADEEE
jgi:hypothetical protein